MIGMLQWGIWGGFNFTDLLNQLEGMGFFQYLLPFLLIFALVYALLGEIPVFRDKKGPALIIALSIGLLSLQWDKVPAFFQAVFPNLGIGLSILLIALLLAGAFIGGDSTSSAFKWIFFGLGGLIFLIVALASLSDYQFSGSYWWDQYAGLIIILLIIAGVIIAVLSGGGSSKTPSKA